MIETGREVAYNQEILSTLYGKWAEQLKELGAEQEAEKILEKRRVVDSGQ